MLAFRNPAILPKPVVLADLEPGASGIIEEIDASGPEGQRLLDLGFVPRTRIRVMRRAPLGDPIEYELRGYRLCLRHSEAARVRVQRSPGGPAVTR